MPCNERWTYVGSYCIYDSSCPVDVLWTECRPSLYY